MPPALTPFYTKYYEALQTPEWYQNELQLPVISVVMVPYLDAGGHHAEVLKITLNIRQGDVVNGNGGKLELVAKLLNESDPAAGYERELFIYKYSLTPLAEQGLINSPKLYFSDFEKSTGSKLLLLESIPSVQCGRFFGMTSPHNHGKDLVEMTMAFPNVTAVSITKAAWSQIAKLHGSYWNVPKKDIPVYIKGRDWVVGRESSEETDEEGKQDEGLTTTTHLSGEEQYNHMIAFARTQWARRHEVRPNTNFYGYLDKIIDFALDYSTWERFIDRLNSVPHTLIHSDFYPANCLLKIDDEKVVPNENNTEPNLDSRLYLIDYELTSVGPGPQDLAQWVISHLHPDLRKDNEDELMQTYYNSLIQAWEAKFGSERCQELQKSYTVSDVKRDYIYGGGKWIWLIAVCVGSVDMISDVLYQHFVTQLTHFFQTHGVEANENVPLPRS